MRVVLLAGLMSLAVATARAAPAPIYGPPPAWVKPASIPAAPPQATGAVRILLQDEQARFAPEGDAFYEERAIKIIGQGGLTAMGNLSFAWDPQTETMLIHRLSILRDGHTIDLLAGGQKFTVIRRETNLAMAMLDGTLTATLAPPGLQVGDVIDFAATRVRHDPVMGGYSQGIEEMTDVGQIQRFRLRALWSAGDSMRWSGGTALGAPMVSTTGAGTEWTIDKTAVTPPKPPAGAPERFQHPGRVTFSDFPSWKAVAALMTPLYEKAEILDAKSPLKAEIAKIAARSADPKVRAADALHLVQKEVRYFYVGLNSGGYTPAAADVTWTRRFGDCKGKTALLLALLKGLGITAEPVLVSTTAGDSLPTALPQVQLFDHVLVRATIGGAIYWLDGTRLADRGLDDISPPAFQWGLPLGPDGGALEAIPDPPPKSPLTELDMRIDLSAGVDTPAPAHVDMIFRGDLGMVTHFGFVSVDAADRDRKLKELWSGAYPWIAVDKVDMAWNDETGTFHLLMDGKASVPWTPYDGGRQFDLPGSSQGGEVSYLRQPGVDADAPYAVGYPMFNLQKDVVVLPHGGAGFSLDGGGDVDTTIAGVAYFRHAALVGGVVTMTVGARALETEFPAVQANSAEASLRRLGEKDVSIDAPPQTTGAPAPSAAAVAVAKPPTPEPQVEPKDAAGLAARGAAHLLERKYDLAADELVHAASLNPKSAEIAYNLAVAEAGLGRYDAASAMFGEALSLRPGYVRALTSRGRLRLAMGDHAGADADFAWALTSDRKSEAVLVAVAEAYEDVGAFEPAMTYWRRAAADSKTSDDHIRALVGGCLTFVELAPHPDAPTEDCQAARKLAPNDENLIYAQGLAALRTGQFRSAFTDFNLALETSPDDANPLYARGLAELGEKQPQAAKTDMDRSASLDPTIAEQFKLWGIGEP